MTKIKYYYKDSNPVIKFKTIPDSYDEFKEEMHFDSQLNYFYVSDVIVQTEWQSWQNIIKNASTSPNRIYDTGLWVYELIKDDDRRISNADVCINHIWKKYEGLIKIDYYCTRCNVKQDDKPNDWKG